MSQYTFGVVADTHVPDRRRELHAALMVRLREADVEQILHAGDISLPKVLRELEKIAPVLAVRGNRDWFAFKDLPLSRVLKVQGKVIGLTHGHGGLLPYVQDKVRYLVRGPQAFSYFMERVISLLPADVNAVVFGHNHAPMLKEQDGKVILNPGSACCQILEGVAPSFGLLHINGDEIRGEIVYLE